nr:PREDICTED: putative ATP-dependent RNA helicase DHX57 [Bemisia tabaci]XP_018900838.1 PREDICTED: putative ATP-dependent RNA helicase DHX57 [Bemisia tabaci]
MSRKGGSSIDCLQDEGFSVRKKDAKAKDAKAKTRPPPKVTIKNAPKAKAPAKITPAKVAPAKVVVKQPVLDEWGCAPQEPPTKLKCEMTNLDLSKDSVDLILNTLKRARGQEFAVPDASSYKDKGKNLNNQYWVDRGELVIKGLINYADPNRKKTTPDQQVHAFAVAKLHKYGFHEKHCSEALTVSDSDVGKAFEFLLTQYFPIKLPDPECKVPQELMDLRRDELDSLKSIYENQVNEKITNKLWTVTVDLPEITHYVLFEKLGLNLKKKAPEKNHHVRKNVCRFFERNQPCRFGKNCRFAHELPKVEKEDDKQVTKFEIEIRFPDGCQYPKEPPFVTVIALNENFPPEISLYISYCLFEETMRGVEYGEPCIFSLIDLVHRHEDIIHFLKTNSVIFPDSISSLIGQNGQLSAKELEDERIKPPRQSRVASENRSDFCDRAKNDLILRQFQTKQQDLHYKKMKNQRQNLPAWSKKDEVLSALEKHQVVVISGETGCGKSTQVPQFILDDWLEKQCSDDPDTSDHINIVCTQPRKISAIGVSERVADERAERIGHTVGYQIRLESRMSAYTRLLFCTTGILLRRLENDPLLNSVTHILVDEVHERSIESDFLLLFLKEMKPHRPDIRIILMSATLNSNLFGEYFSGVPVIHIPGRTFPVDQYFLENVLELCQYPIEENSEFSRKIGKSKGREIDELEEELEVADALIDNGYLLNDRLSDERLSCRQLFFRYQAFSKQTRKSLFIMDPEKINYELIEALIVQITDPSSEFPQEGSILVFLPGFFEIKRMMQMLSDNPRICPQRDDGRFILIPLHSTLTNEEQAQVFRKPPRGKRKIVLSTNVAETSITIDDCTYVIDSGRMKEKRFDPDKNMESLELIWVSRANALQRKGRAGRVRSGTAFHLFTEHRFNCVLDAQPLPEMHRAPLESLLLNIKTIPVLQDRRIEDVLAGVIEPPPPDVVQSSMIRLQNVGAFDSHNNLTPLGKHLAALPVDVRIGKLMLFGAIFCCVDSALTIAAILSHKSFFISSFDDREAADATKKEFLSQNSDHITALRAYKSWCSATKRGHQASRNFARAKYLSYTTLTAICDIKAQFLELLASIGFIPFDIGRIRKRTKIDCILEITGEELNENGRNETLLSAVLAAALYPNIVKVLTPEKTYTHLSSGSVISKTPDAADFRFKTKQDGYVSIHPSSIFAKKNKFSSPYLVFQEKCKTSKIYVRDCTMVKGLPLVLFCGSGIDVELHSGTFVISLEKGWIMFTAKSHMVAELLKALQVELLALLNEKIKDPSIDLTHHATGKRVISTIVHVITHS